METTILTFPKTETNWPEPSLFPDFQETKQVSTSGKIPVVERKGNVLSADSVTRDPNVMAIRLLEHKHFTCKMWPFPILGRNGWSRSHQFIADSAAQLQKRLHYSSDIPKAVFVNPVGDPFLPSSKVQEETSRVIEVLAGHGIQSWLMTRGYIKPSILRRLTPIADKVQIMVGITTLEQDIHREWEPFTCNPELRLKQIANLRELGFSVQVALEPLIPDITDTKTNLIPVLEMLSDMDVTNVSAGYLYIPERAWDFLSEELPIRDKFKSATLCRIGTLANCRLLPKSVRQKGYARLMSLASTFGIKVRISSLSNPDFTRTMGR